VSGNMSGRIPRSIPIKGAWSIECPMIKWERSWHLDLDWQKDGIRKFIHDKTVRYREQPANQFAGYEKRPINN